MKQKSNFISEFLFLLGNSKKKLPLLILLFLAVSMLDLAGLGLIGPYVALVMSPDEMINGPIGKYLSGLGVSMQGNDLLITLGLGLVAVFFFKAAAAIFINWNILRFSTKARVELQENLMHAYQNQPYIEYLQRNSSEYIQSIYDSTAHFVTGIQILLRMLSEGIVCLFVIGFLAVTNIGALSLLVALLGVTMFIYLRFFRNKAKLYGQKAIDGVRGMVQGIHEGINGLKEIRILGKTSHFHETVSASAKDISANWIKSTIIALAPKYLLEFVLISFVVSFVVASLLWGSDLKSIMPTLGIFGVAALRLMPSANLFTSGVTKLRFGRQAISNLYQDLKKMGIYAYRDSEEKLSNNAAESFNKLELSDLNFCYPKAKNWALKELTLSINSGESIGIIGPSGSGKTTLIDVFLGLLEPQQGSIRYNTKELKDSLADWCSQVAYLPQEIFLIDNTLRCNIALGVGDGEIDEIRVYEAIKQAQLSELLEQLPDGIETILGERGVRLSGGQRQRVALARAFYHGRNVLVLDEATSALDNATEREIVEEIKSLKGQKTLIVIAHRLSTVEHCDRIYKLDKGRIVNVGTYEQVVSKSDKVEI